jgi:hypothetical protein
VNYPLLILFGFTVVLLVLLSWGLRDPHRVSRSDTDICCAEDMDRRHVAFFPQVKQALTEQDSAYIASRGMHTLARRIRKERRKIALTYLDCLRGDFLKLWRLARVIASMSQQIGTVQELERLRLGFLFSWRYEMVRLKFQFGFAPLPQLGSLSEVVSRLSIRMETSMKDMGERAALAAKLASSLDGRGLDTP